MINDPRKYSEVYPKTNRVISQALQVLEGTSSTQELDDIIADNLRRENDALINVALNLAPGVAACSEVWKSLNRAINDKNLSSYANIFAIPLILVAGSKTKLKLKPQLDVEALNQFFNEQQLFNPGFDTFISGKLIEPQKLAAIKPSQLYYWVRNLNNSRLWLPVEMPGSSVEVFNEGVFLRFLIGVSIDVDGKSGLNLTACNDNLMQLMRLIHNELKTDGVTLFPIPFAPVPLSSAFAVGTEYRTEIALSVALSNVVRRLHESQLTPVAKITTEGEAIKIQVTSREPSDIIETSICNMNRFADFNSILSNLTNLLHDVGAKLEYAANAD